jgi:hypothetical protein
VIRADQYARLWITRGQFDPRCVPWIPGLSPRQRSILDWLEFFSLLPVRPAGVVSIWGRFAWDPYRRLWDFRPGRDVWEGSTDVTELRTLLDYIARQLPRHDARRPQRSLLRTHRAMGPVSRAGTRRA